MEIEPRAIRVIPAPHEPPAPDAEHALRAAGVPLPIPDRLDVGLVLAGSAADPAAWTRLVRGLGLRGPGILLEEGTPDDAARRARALLEDGHAELLIAAAGDGARILLTEPMARALTAG